MTKMRLKRLLFYLSIATVFAVAKQTIAAGPTVLSVTATVLSKSVCKFQTKASALAFGNLVPSSGANVTAVTTIGFVCNGSAPNATFLMTKNNGLNGTGPGNNRMRHATLLSEFIPYSASLSPSSATVPKGVVQTLTVTGTVNALDYQNAAIGSYSDAVIITITP